MIYMNVAYLVVSAIWARKSSFNILTKFLLFASGLILIFLTALETISDRFTGLGFNDAVVFHMQYGLEGAGIEQFYPIIAKSSVCLLLAIVVWGICLFSKANKRFRESICNTAAVLASTVSLISAHPTAHAIYRLVNPNRSGLPMVNFYVKPSIDAMPLNLSNIVWIYGESLERTYIDETAFPGLMPNLRAIEDESLSFTDIEQIGSSGWTIAGIVASQCGIPLGRDRWRWQLNGLHAHFSARSHLHWRLAQKGELFTYLHGWRRYDLCG